jgi:hypothetical protein
MKIRKIRIIIIIFKEKMKFLKKAIFWIRLLSLRVLILSSNKNRMKYFNLIKIFFQEILTVINKKIRVKFKINNSKNREISINLKKKNIFQVKKIKLKFKIRNNL